MAISIVSDLVLDVVKAADPERVKTAQAVLQGGTMAADAAMTADAARQFVDAENSAERTSAFHRFQVTDMDTDMLNAPTVRPSGNLAQLASFMPAVIPAANEPTTADAANPVQHKYGIGRVLTRDIVEDVVNAADPAAVKISAAKLSGPQPAQVQMASLEETGSVVAPSGETDVAQSPRTKAYQQFEATVLRTFVEEMLPKSTDAVYGEGTAGNVWRSMQADFMSQEMAKSGGVGIATMLARLDEAKAQGQLGASLNQISPPVDRMARAIVHTSEWPYFSHAGIGVLES